MFQFGVLPSFSPITRTWSTFKNRLTQWFIANDIAITEETAVKRRAILLNALDDGTYELANLSSPKSLEELPYEDIIKILDDHFTPKRRGFTNRHKFYTAVQLSHETYNDWSARLRGLVESCGFSDVEEALRDRFVIGSVPGLVKERLYEQDTEKLTLLEAVELAESVHCARDERFAGTNMNIRYNNKGPFGPNYASGFKLGATAPTAAAFGTTSNSGGQFGATAPTAAAFGATSTSGGQFGATAPTAAAFGATSTSGGQFGATAPTAAAFGTTSTSGSQFGATAPTAAAFGTTSTSGGLFGTTAPTAAAFGATNTSYQNSLFGATAPRSVFGPTTTTGGLFGGVTPAFGTNKTSSG